MAGKENDRIYFLERLSHDIRSSLASIQGYADIVAEGQPQDDPHILKDYAKIIAEQSWRLGKMIDDAVVCTRISENQFNLTLKSVRLAPLIDLLFAEIKEKNDRVISYRNELEGCHVLGDPYYLRDAIKRIIDNGLKFSRRRVDVFAFIEDNDNGSRANLVVEDDGLGIKETDLPLLFQPFGKIRDERTRGIPGSGLSLFIVKSIIDCHGGEVSIHSHPGHGTKVMFSLPLLKEEG